MIYSDRYSFNFSYIFKSEDSLNSYNGTDLIINPFSYKLSRYQQFDFGFPFLSSPEHIYSLKPEIKVRFQAIKAKKKLFLLQVDSHNIITVFDEWTYLLILVSILVVSLVYISMLHLQDIIYPTRHTQTFLYVVAAFFQETYPRSKLPRGGMRVDLQFISDFNKVTLPAFNSRLFYSGTFTPCL